MIYFDNASTTKIDEKVLTKMNEFYLNNYANIDSIHDFGIETYNKIEKEMEILRDIFNVDKYQFNFTSGGSEANNIAVTSVLNNFKKGHIITTVFEHPSLLNTLKNYENNFDITYINPKLGKINYEDVKKEIRDDTFFITLTSCNSELGIIYDIDEVANQIKKEYKNIIIHSDFVQALGHKKIDMSNIDMLTISSHKIHGPKGVGALYIKKGVKNKPFLFGDNKNNGIMKRTMPSDLVYGFLTALKYVYSDEKEEYIEKIKNYAINELKTLFKDNIFIVKNDGSNILAFSIKNLRSEILFNYLSSNNIYISVGSACSHGANKTIKSLNLPKEYEKGMVRLSFSKNNNMEEIDELIKKLKEFNKIYKIF